MTQLFYGSVSTMLLVVTLYTHEKSDMCNSSYVQLLSMIWFRLEVTRLLVLLCKQKTG
jgi:hypothetical protein